MRFGPLVIAILLAVVCGFVTMQLIGSQQPAPVATQVAEPMVKEVETVNVLISRGYVPIGTVVTAQRVTSQPWPKNLVGPNFIIEGSDANAVVGKVARASFQEGEPFSMTKLAGANEGSFLAGSLPKGMRAVTINTDETLGVAGFIFPGDKVDVLVTHRVPKWDQLRDSPDQQDITETLLGNISVLAVDQIANAREIAANSRQQSQNGDNNSTIHVPRTATLMVSAADAQKLRLAEKVGQLSLALRSVSDHDAVDISGMTLRQDITGFEIDSVVNPKVGGGAGGDDIRLIRGTEAVNVVPREKIKKSLPAMNKPLQLVSSLVSAQTSAGGTINLIPNTSTSATSAAASLGTSPSVAPVVTVPSVQTVPAL
jgi:pilus assembly protein CpaB